MTIFTTKGTKFYIGGVMAQKSDDFVLADFTTPPQTWARVKHIEGLGTIGDTANEVTFNDLDSGRTLTLKGTRKGGNMELVCGIDDTDPGQQAIIAAAETDYDYAFKIVPEDAPPGGTPSERYFIGKVMSQSEQFDQADNVVKLNASIAINSNTVRVAREEA